MNLNRVVIWHPCCKGALYICGLLLYLAVFICFSYRLTIHLLHRWLLNITVTGQKRRRIDGVGMVRMGMSAGGSACVPERDIFGIWKVNQDEEKRASLLSGWAASHVYFYRPLCRLSPTYSIISQIAIQLTLRDRRRQLMQLMQRYRGRVGVYLAYM